MSHHKAWEGQYNGERAIWLKWGKYEAALLPEIGGNLITFKDTETGYTYIHGPEESEMEAFKARPMVHGIPVLFPPNRYEDGKFPWQGKTLQLPVNEPDRNNHLHGFLYNVPWQVDEFGETSTESYVVVSVTVDENHPSYEHFPFQYAVTLRYSLSDDGLLQHVIVRNNGEEAMPCLLAFHTSLKAPFAPGGSAKDYKVKMTIGQRWELTDRMLPTTRHQPLSAEEEQLKGEGVYPFFAELDNHYTAEPQNGRNRMELTDTKNGVTLVYDVGTSYNQWMLWNNFQTEGFFCAEPHVNMVNAPNLDLPAEQTGLVRIDAGELWEETSRLFAKKA